jgi:hypothetical protein
MSATAAQIAQLRRMVNEPTTTTYSDATLATYIEAYPLMDERGEEPYTWDTSTEPPTEEDNDNWLATYDLAAAAADVWSEKAAAPAEDFDTNADGADLKRSQAYEQAMKQARYYRSRRAARTITQVPVPRPTNDDLVAN